MLLEKITNSKKLLLFAFVVFFLFTRFLGLYSDIINPDGVNWHHRSEQFVAALKAYQIENTYQHYHPGVTVMWVVGTVVEIARQIDPNFRPYDHENFLFLHFLARASLIFVQGALSLLVIFLLNKLYEFKRSLFIVSLFTFEPFFVGNSRLLHLDILLTLLLFLGIVCSYLSFKKKNYRFAVATGFFMSLAFLTKSIAVLGVGFAILSGSYFGLILNGRKFALRFPFVVLLFFVITSLVVLPALLIEPGYVLKDIFLDAQRVGGRTGHSQFFFGKETMDPGVFFYPIVVSIKTSVVMIFGILAAIIGFLVFLSKNHKNLKMQDISLEAYMVVFYLGYFLLMTLMSKKLDRYMLVMFPFFAIVSVWGFYRLQSFFANNKTLIAFLILTYFAPLIYFFPYYFAFSSPLYRNLEFANGVVGQKPFGVAIPRLKEFIFEKYGEYPTIGFIDTKPMGMIYPRSKIRDIRTTGAKDIDLYVLGPNETAPDSINSSGRNFEFDSSFKINGMDYWRIYVDKDKEFNKK